MSPIAVRPDGKYIYASDPYTKDFSIIDTETSSPLKFHPLNGAPRGQLISSDRKRVVAFSDKHGLALDMKTNEILLRVKLNDRLRQVLVFSDTSDLVGLTGKEFLAWDSEAGREIGRISGLHNVKFAVELPKETAAESPGPDLR